MYEEKSVKFENLPEEIQEYSSQQNVCPFTVFTIDNMFSVNCNRILQNMSFQAM